MISLIVTTKNEAGSLPRLLDSMIAQECPPDEIVIADGGSSDATMEILRAYTHRLPLRIISQPGTNISQGRNAAIRAARGDVVCSTDAGVRLDSRWLAELLKCFQQPGAMPPDVVSGFFLPDPQSIFETALAATTLPALSDIQPERFLPSSRSIAFRKSAWEQVGGYPEWLDYCEDLVFDFALRAAGFHFAFAPRARVYFRPRTNLVDFVKQYYRYARGDGKADLWFRRHLIRYATYLIALPTLLALTVIYGWVVLPLWLAALLAILYTPYKRLVGLSQSMGWPAKLQAAVWVPIIRVAGDVAKMMGYPVGVAWRLRVHHTASS